ncbi:MAG: ABC transporter substrate-binding protein [Kosmotogaceae bacterium]
MKKVLVFTLVLLFAVALFSADLVKAYTTLEEPLAKELFDLFEEQTGINVEWVRLSTGETVARLEAERENPQASIWVGGVGLGHIEAKLKDLTTPYRSPLALDIPARYRDPEFYWVGLYVGPLAFCTNTNRAEELGIEAPKGWFDIIDSRYRGMVRVANPNTSGTAYNVITTILHLFGEDEDLTFNFLEHLDKNVNMYTRSGSAGGKDAAIGETPIAIGYLHDLIRLQKNGAPIEITIPEEGTGFEIASMSLIKGGKEPLEAKKLYNFVLGEDAQEIISKWFVIPLSPEAPKDKVEIPLDEINTIEQDFVWDAENRERLLERWNSEIGQ